MEDAHRDELDDQAIIEAIRQAALAGSYGYWARQEPTAARGLLKMRDKSSAAATALLTDWTAQRANAGPSVVEDDG